MVFSDLLWPHGRCALDQAAHQENGLVCELARQPACPVGLQVWEAQPGGRQLCNLRVDLTESDGEVVKVNNWGKKRLAYQIQKQDEGIYYLMDLNLVPTSIAELERNLKILEPVMRHLIVAK